VRGEGEREGAVGVERVQAVMPQRPRITADELSICALPRKYLLQDVWTKQRRFKLIFRD